MMREEREKRTRWRRCGRNAVNLVSQRGHRARETVQQCDAQRHLIRILTHSYFPDTPNIPNDTFAIKVTAFDLAQHQRIAQACAKAALSGIKRDHIDIIEQWSQCRSDKRLLHSFCFDLVKDNKRLVDILHASDYEIAA